MAEGSLTQNHYELDRERPAGRSPRQHLLDSGKFPGGRPVDPAVLSCFKSGNRRVYALSGDPLPGRAARQCGGTRADHYPAYDTLSRYAGDRRDRRAHSDGAPRISGRDRMRRPVSTVSCRSLYQWRIAARRRCLGSRVAVIAPHRWVLISYREPYGIIRVRSGTFMERRKAHPKPAVARKVPTSI